MLWGIDRDAWISIWAGTLGAIPAAVISAAVAAWVAVRVLNRSNAHQKELGDRQLADQRLEAALAREKVALAAVVGAASRMLDASRLSRDAINLEHAHLDDAVIRWRLELGPSAMGEELKWWDSLLLAAAVNRFEEAKKGLAGEPEKAFEILNDSVARIASIAMRWQSANEASKLVLVEHLSEHRRRRAGELEEMMGVPFPG